MLMNGRTYGRGVRIIHSFLYKNIVFPAETEYFSAYIRLKILLWVLLDYSV